MVILHIYGNENDLSNDDERIVAKTRVMKAMLDENNLECGRTKWRKQRRQEEIVYSFLSERDTSYDHRKWKRNQIGRRDAMLFRCETWDRTPESSS